MCLLERKLWLATMFLLAAVMVTPIVFLFSSWVYETGEIWLHLKQTLLARYFLNSFWLLLGVLPFTFILGVGLAGVTVFLSFPGRRFFSWALIVPLAIPAYVFAFIFSGLFESGSFLLESLIYLGMISASDHFSFQGRSGAILVLSFAFYPYVYLLTRQAFLSQGVKAMEVGRSLGHSPLSCFLKISLPLAKPWILGGLVLVAMEALADFGAVSILSYDTFTTGIYKAWFSFFSLQTAAQLATILIAIILGFVLLREFSSSRQSHEGMDFKANSGGQNKLARHWQLLAFTLCLIVFLTTVVIPLIALLQWSLEEDLLSVLKEDAPLIVNSISIAVLSSIVMLVVAVLLSCGKRLYPVKLSKLCNQFSTLGYALPGTVLAVAVFIPLTWLDKHLTVLLGLLTGENYGLILSGSLFAVVLGLSIRFHAIMHAAINNAMKRLPESLDEASLMFGNKGWRRVKRIYLPLLKPGIATGALLVFVESMKEMPLTLMTRPFGWDTLSTNIFELTSEGEWEMAAVPALLLVILGLLPVYFMIKRQRMIS